MAKITSTNVSSGFNTTINTNFSAIDDELNNKVLYRDNPTGEPNTMVQELDMNSNKILNVGAPSDNNDAARLQDVIDFSAQPSVDVVSAVFPIQQLRQSGDGIITEFDTPATVHALAVSLMVYLNGVRQRPNTSYTTDSDNIGKVTFVSAPLTGDDIDVILYSPVTSTATGAALPIAGGTMTGELVLDHLTEQVHVMATVDVNASNGNWQTRTLAGNETFTFTLAAGQHVFVTTIKGANTLTLSNVDEWVGGSAPSPIEAEHAFVFWSDDGVTVTGNSVGGIS